MEKGDNLSHIYIYIYIVKLTKTNAKLKIMYLIFARNINEWWIPPSVQ